MSDSSTPSLTAWLADHPRMLGALFMLMVVLSSVQPVAAAANSTNPGP